jgi:hypothetical protein
LTGMIPPGGFEPPSPAPKACMIDHYTTGVPDDTTSSVPISRLRERVLYIQFRYA